MITLFNLARILNSRFILLEGFFVNLNKIIDSLLYFGLPCSQMSASKAQTCIKYFYFHNDSAFIAKRTTHACFDSILMHCPEGIYPWFADIEEKTESNHLYFLDFYKPFGGVRSESR